MPALLVMVGLAQTATSVVAYAEEAEEEYARHVVELFVGGATRFSEEEDPVSGFAYGLGYEYRFLETLGIGLTGEGTTGDLRDGLLVFPVYFHPWRGLKVQTAPGVEFSSEPAEWVVRVGLSYEFEVWRRLSLSPEYNVDFVQGEQTMVYGLSMGWSF